MGSARREACRPRTNSGTATARTEPPRANAMAASMGVRDRKVGSEAAIMLVSLRHASESDLDKTATAPFPGKRERAPPSHRNSGRARRAAVFDHSSGLTSAKLGATK